MKLMIAALAAALTCYAQTPAPAKEAPKPEVKRKDISEVVQQRALRILAESNTIETEKAAAEAVYRLRIAPIQAQWNELVTEQCVALKVPEEKLGECKLDPNKKPDAKFGEVRWEKKPAPQPETKKDPPAAEPTK